MRILCEQLHDHWSAWVEGRAEIGFGGASAAHCAERLAAELGVDFSKFVSTKEAVDDRQALFRLEMACPECGGSSRYMGLQEVDDCKMCGGLRTVWAFSSDSVR